MLPATMSRLRITFLGTGTSQGVPMIGCDCAVCRSDDPRNQRLRCALLLETDEGNLLIDTPPDLRTQALRANLRRVDAVLITHTHTDHVMGMDDLRRFSDLKDAALPIYGSAVACERLKQIYPFVFDDQPKRAPYLRATLHPLEAGRTVDLLGCRLTPVTLPHGRMPTFGYLIEQNGELKLAYLNDCKDVPAEALARSRGARIMVLDALRYREHPTHMCLDEALAVARRACAERVYLTHMTHDIEHAALSAQLPASVALAYDGLTVEA